MLEVKSFFLAVAVSCFITHPPAFPISIPVVARRSRGAPVFLSRKRTPGPDASVMRGAARETKWKQIDVCGVKRGP